LRLASMGILFTARWSREKSFREVDYFRRRHSHGGTGTASPDSGITRCEL
jgi:hypothetical protein